MANEVIRMTEVGLTEMIDEIGRVGGEPSFRVIAKLEETLAENFAMTQERVHVITGSLKLSGFTDSHWDPESYGWTGTIIYGGASTGPNNPVDYAIYEMARGGEHDFMADVPEDDHGYKEAIEQHFKGGH